MISDRDYHELAANFPNMHRKTQLAACRQELNSEFEIHRTLGMLPGSFFSLTEELQKDITRIQKEKQNLPATITIKLSGDGARVSRVSNFLVFSYSWIDFDDSNSHLNQRDLAIVNCGENYNNI